MTLSIFPAAHRALAPVLASLLLAGCAGSSDSGQPSALQTIGNVVMFQSTTVPRPEPRAQTANAGAVADPLGEDETLVCPQVIVAEGGAAVRAQGGGDSGSLRHQISILNVARECGNARPGGGFTLKVGAEGRVLLGPAGGAGSYYATLTTQVLRGTTVVARRSARVGGTIPAGQGGTDFAHVEDAIVVPPGNGDVEIIVGLGPAGAAGPGRRR